MAFKISVKVQKTCRGDPEAMKGIGSRDTILCCTILFYTILYILQLYEDSRGISF